MAALRDLLEVYGALDEAVAESSNPAIGHRGRQFFPEVLSELRVVSGDRALLLREECRAIPNLGEACREARRARQRSRKAGDKISQAPASAAATEATAVLRTLGRGTHTAGRADADVGIVRAGPQGCRWWRHSPR